MGPADPISIDAFDVATGLDHPLLVIAYPGCTKVALGAIFLHPNCAQTEKLALLMEASHLHSI